MSKQYAALAKDIVSLIGGKENVTNVRHCQTRLRFSLVDESVAKTKQMETLDGVTKVMSSGGVYQVVIGAHVADVFEEVEKLVDVSGEDKAASGEKKGILNAVIDFVSGTFQPIIPALSGAGMVKAVMALLVVFHIISPDTQTYYMLNIFADGVFYFLPVLLAFSEAQKLKCNPLLAAGVAAMMLHPNWLALVNASDAVPVYFFGVIPFTLASYASSVIPIILVVFVQSYVEKLLKKWIPKSIELVFVPMLTFLVMGVLAFSVLGPIGNIVGKYLATFFTYLSTNASWAPAVLIGGLLPIMVMFGIHNGVAPLGVMQMADLGYDSIFGPGCVCSNMAQATAGLVVALRTKNKKEKQTAASGSVTAYMGITEPILYGTNLPKKYPLAAAMIGGGLGGLYAGLTHTHRFATGSSGLPAVLLYIGDDTMTYFINIIIAIVISIVTSAVITFVLSLRYEKNETASMEQKQDETHVKDEILIAPVEGEVHSISESKDEVFATEVLGKGVMLYPESDSIVAPADGVVTSLYPTGHAIGIQTENGAEVLIHIGVDTVKLDGKYFKVHIAQGDFVKAGEPLVTFDRKAIEKEGYATETMVVVTNSPAYQSIRTGTHGMAKTGERLLELQAY